MRVTVTPKFSSRRIYSKNLGSIWFEFQESVFQLGKSLQLEMRRYINANAKRGVTGRLSQAINRQREHGPGFVRVGIGEIDMLNQRAPYWYVINFGKKTTGEEFVPGGGKYRPIRYTGGPPDPSMRGQGNERATDIGTFVDPALMPSIIRPINYIEYTSRLAQEGLRKIRNSLTRGGSARPLRGL